jgi:hypothetical protein
MVEILPAEDFFQGITTRNIVSEAFLGNGPSSVKDRM